MVGETMITTEAGTMAIGTMEIGTTVKEWAGTEAGETIAATAIRLGTMVIPDTI